MPTNYSSRVEYTSEDLNGRVTRMHRVFEDCGITVRRFGQGYIWEIRNDRLFASAEDALKDAKELLESNSIDTWEPIYLIARRAER